QPAAGRLPRGVAPGVGDADDHFRALGKLARDELGAGAVGEPEPHVERFGLARVEHIDPAARRLAAGAGFGEQALPCRALLGRQRSAAFGTLSALARFSTTTRTFAVIPGRSAMSGFWAEITTV